MVPPCGSVARSRTDSFMERPSENGSPEAAVCLLRGKWRSGDRADLRGLLALRAVLHFELDLLVLLEGLEARTLDLGEMGEEVLAAAVGFDEAEALGVVEPLHGTGAHCISFRCIPR